MLKGEYPDMARLPNPPRTQQNMLFVTNMLLDCLKQTTKTDHPSASRLANDLCLVTSARLYAVKSTGWVEREENRPGTCHCGPGARPDMT